MIRGNARPEVKDDFLCPRQRPNVRQDFPGWVSLFTLLQLLNDSVKPNSVQA